ncbi:MAG: hypothetical protein ACTSSG_13560 [Candidatus Heimdallarchaeaceae archaeon]
MASDIIKKDIELPALPEKTVPLIEALTKALGISREVLASKDEIYYAWRDLPRELMAIPPKLRNELIARMCIAISTGLFDGAINYIWNATILHLRQRVRDFGLPVVARILQKQFEEKDLIELQDSELIDLCLKLNLITEDGYFFLSQCRDTRNNFSAAHPTIGKINDREFITFLNRCVRYALCDEISPKGVDIGDFITAIKGERFTQEQLDVWIGRINATHDAQRELLFDMLHGIYCDPSSSEPTRLNALDICLKYKSKFTSSMKSILINRHQDYIAKGDKTRHKESQQFFEKLGLISLLTESERHSIISKALNILWQIHRGLNNFYNEPPFAERLHKLSKQTGIPNTIKENYVNVVVSCYLGNGYGFSWAAEPYYNKMIHDFSPKEIEIMIDSASKNDTYIGMKLRAYLSCRKRFSRALRSLIDITSVPESVKGKYKKYTKIS